MPNDDYIKRSDAVFELYRYASAKDPALMIAHRVDLCERIEKIPSAAVEPVRRWIPVTEDIPKRSIPCLVACNQWGGEVVRKAIFLASENCFTERGSDITKYVTHWMESPKPPEEDDNGDK